MNEILPHPMLKEIFMTTLAIITIIVTAIYPPIVG